MAKVLLIGSGGREHALGWKLAQSPHVHEILFAPGNGGTVPLGGKGRNLPLAVNGPEDFGAVASLIAAEEITLTVVGPEAPLSEGLVDYLRDKQTTPVFGPTQACARLEADKFFSHELMQTLKIPHAKGVLCHTEEEAKAAIATLSSSGQVVLKARGLAAGKGVVVCDSADEAHAALPSLLGTYGADLLVCERLFGPEFSVFALCNGEQLLPFPLAFQDHKPLLDGDKGPNTGGMGAYGPAPIAPPAMIKRVVEEGMAPILRHFAEAGTPFSGFLYAGMMLTEEGPKVLEYNVRFGDPECQPAMQLLDEDLYELFQGCLAGRLENRDVKAKAGAACCVVLASQGYPGVVTKGLGIQGFEAATQVEGVKIFHAGTRSADGSIVTNGGRVLGVTGYAAEGLATAQANAYKAASRLQIEGGFHYRTDIANKAL